MATLANELAVEPRFGRSPVALDGDGRYLQDLSRLLHAEPAKKAHLDNLHFARIELRQSIHGVIERDQVRALILPDDRRLFQGNMPETPAPCQIMPPGVFHQDAPHQLGGNRIEM